jgi:hypothetical protein
MRPRTALAALLAVSVLLDLVFFTGFIASDDVLYMTAARRLAETGRLWPDPAAHEARLLMIGWCALLGLCFRHDVQAVAASFVFFHQALTVLTFVLARPLQGLGGALLAAALSATFPTLVVFSTTILPDIPMTACLVAAFVALRAGFRGEAAICRVGLPALSGASVGAAYLAKESGLVPLPLVLAMALFAGASSSGSGDRAKGALTRAASLLSGLLLVLGLEAVALRALTGSWYFRLGAFFAGESGSAPFFAALGRRAALLADVAGAHLAAAAALVALLAGVAACARHRPGLRWVLLFPAWYAAYYAWGSAQLTSYYAPSLQARYFIPCAPFLMVGVSVMLCALYERAAGAARRAQPPRDRALRVVAATALSAAVMALLAVCDRNAGAVYGAPLVSQSLRALRSESSSLQAPVVISEVLGAQIFPLLQERPEGVLFSHEVGPVQLEQWRRLGGFRFMDLHPASALDDAELNPLLRWPHGLPASGRVVERLVASLLSGETIDGGWTMRPAGTFDLLGPRSAEIRALFGDTSALLRLRPRPDRGVVVFRLAAAGDDVVYPLPPFDPRERPAVVNGTFGEWSAAGPAGWQARDALPSRVRGPGGDDAVRIGPGEFGYLWQSLDARRSVRGRALVLRASVRSDEPEAARLWIKVAMGAHWEETIGEPHPGDGTWRPLEAVVSVPPAFPGGELRIALLHARAGGRSEFADVTVSVR